VLASRIDHDACQLHAGEHHGWVRVEVFTVDEQRRLIRRNARGCDDRFFTGRRDSGCRDHHRQGDDGRGCSSEAHHSGLHIHVLAHE
jgi:hypothetical protein